MKPKLTLRDLLAIVTIVAMALGWWVDRSRLAEAMVMSNARCKVLAAEVDELNDINDSLTGKLRWLTHELRSRDAQTRNV